MTGVRITVDDSALQTALRRLTDANAGLVPTAMKVFSQAVLNSTRARFQRQVDPDGNPWAPLNPTYAAGKRGTKILQEMGMAGGLLGSINAQTTPSRFAIGTNKIYGAIQHFGGTIVAKNYPALVFRMGGKLCWARKVTIPSRRFLGLSREDRAEIPLLAQDILDALAKGGP